MPIRIRPPRETLEYLYVSQVKSLKEIASTYSVAQKLVCKWLQLYSIPTRMSARKASLASISEDMLRKMYSFDKIGTPEIARIFNTNHRTVLNLLQRFGISTRSFRDAQRVANGTDTISDDELICLYKSGKSQKEIGEIYALAQTSIGRKLRKLGIDMSAGKIHAGVKNGMYGRTHTPEAREKIRQANIRQFSDPSAREQHAVNTCRQIKDGRTGKSYNKLETKIAQQFADSGIEFEQQYRLGRFLYDFYLPATHELVEAHGTFWHADPRKYSDRTLTPIQIRNTANDIRKQERANKDGYGFRVIWEMDV